MNRFFLPFVLFWLFSSAFPLASFAEGSRTITILYTGSVKGTIDPCIACACDKNGSGGLARRAQMIESIRKGEPSVLLLDSGTVFDDKKDTAELQLQAMELMRYDALNLGGPEFNFGKEFLEHTRSLVSFPYLASNLLSGGSRIPWIREYIIKEVGGIKVAILGVLDPDGLAQLPDQEQLKGLKVIPPEAALNRLLHEVKGKADLVILLSQFGAAKTLALVKAVKGVDVAISSGSDDQFIGKAPENTILLHTLYLGRTMGLVKITLDEKRALSVSERRDVPLDSSVPGNEKIERLVQNFKKNQGEKKHEERMEALKLSPEEFIERYRKEQTEKRNGAAR
ncbi:MAG: bifunctional UDP-sugar hydrolase/5'-nucleotidase [Syntrophales bacterium]